MAEYLANLNNGKIDEKGMLRLFGTILTQSGVIDSGSLVVAAQATPDATVKIAGGATGHDVVFKTSTGELYHGWNTADKNLTIVANSSGVTKTDAIVVYADLAAGAGSGGTSNNPGGLKFIAVRRGGSDAGNPTEPEISTAVGGNPYLVLAYVTVANAATSINSGNITDARVRVQVESSNIETLVEANFAAGTMPVSTVKSEAWTSFTPSLAVVSGTAPTIGNGSLNGKYIKQGRLVTVHIEMVFGSTSTAGSGIWLFGLPVALNNSAYVGEGENLGCLGSLLIGDAGVASYIGVVQGYNKAGTAYALCNVPDATTPARARFVTEAAPMTWATNDSISIVLTYEAAS